METEQATMLQKDSRLYAAKKAYEKTHKIDDLFATMDMMGCLPPARKL